MIESETPLLTEAELKSALDRLTPVLTVGPGYDFAEAMRLMHLLKARMDAGCSPAVRRRIQLPEKRDPSPMRIEVDEVTLRVAECSGWAKIRADVPSEARWLHFLLLTTGRRFYENQFKGKRPLTDQAAVALAKKYRTEIRGSLATPGLTPDERAKLVELLTKHINGGPAEFSLAGRSMPKRNRETATQIFLIRASADFLDKHPVQLAAEERLDVIAEFAQAALNRQPDPIDRDDVRSALRGWAAE